MSIAALMVDLNDLPSYTQEDDGPNNDDINESAMSMESVYHEMDLLDHTIASLSDIQMTLESSNDDLSEDALKYLGLALDATLGKPRTLYIGGSAYDTHTGVFTLEDAASNKKGLWMTIWRFIVRQFENVRKVFSNIYKYVIGLFSKDVKKHLYHIRDFGEATKDHVDVEDEFVISEEVMSVLGYDGMPDIPDLIVSISMYASKIGGDTLHSINLILESAVNIIDSPLTEDTWLHHSRFMDGVSRLCSNITFRRPTIGNYRAVTVDVRETTFNKLYTAANPYILENDGMWYIDFVGNPTKGEFRMPSNLCLYRLYSLQESSVKLRSVTASYMKIFDSPEWKKIANAKTPKEPTDADRSDPAMAARIESNLKMRAAMLASPVFKFPATMLLWINKIQDALLMLWNESMAMTRKAKKA